LSLPQISTDYHKKLVSIPHFHGIITTNYDNLFEDNCGNGCQVIVTPEDVPYIDNKKKQIFKVHGDLSKPESIIISSSDYNTFFKYDSQNNVYWSVIKERIATKNVLFLGYNIEDSNIRVIYEKITDSLKHHKKECFLVAPNLNQAKINDLNRQDIHYIDSKAEEIIDELIDNIKANIVADLHLNKVSADTFKRFCNNYQIAPDLKDGESNFIVSGFKGLKNEPLDGKINFKIKKESEAIKSLKELIEGNYFGEIDISKEELEKMNLTYNGITAVSTEDADRLKIKSTPRVDSKIDLRFENGEEFTDIPVVIFTSKVKIEIRAQLINSVLSITIHLPITENLEPKVHYSHNEICERVQDEIALFTILENFTKGSKFTAYGKDGFQTTNTFRTIPDLHQHSVNMLNYLGKLKEIENNYNIRFTNFPFTSISESIDSIDIVHSVINNKPLSGTMNSDKLLEVDIDKSAENIIQVLEEIDTGKFPLTSHFEEVEYIELIGHKLNLGYKIVEYLDLEVTNWDSIKSKRENVAFVKSKTKQVKIFYSSEKN